MADGSQKMAPLFVSVNEELEILIGLFKMWTNNNNLQKIYEIYIGGTWKFKVNLSLMCVEFKFIYDDYKQQIK